MAQILIAAIAILIAGMALGFAVFGARKPSVPSGEDAPAIAHRAVAPRWRTWAWLQSGLSIYSVYAEPGLAYTSRELSVDVSQIYESSQLLVATTEGDDRVLDCVIPVTSGKGRTMVAPITLRGRLPQGTATDDADRLIETWINASGFVDIALIHRRGTQVVLITNDTSTLTLEHVRAAPSN